VDPVVIWDTFAFDGPTNRNRVVGCLSACDDPLTDASFQWADWFLVSGGDHTLDAVALRFVNASGHIVVRLWDDAGGVPGTLLEELPAIPGPFTSMGGVDKETQSVTEPTLLDGEVYWISVAMQDPLKNAAWRKADLARPPPAPLVSDELMFAPTNEEPLPDEWSPLAPDEGDVDGDGDQDPLPGAYFGVMRVTAIPAPEPELVLLHASALALVGALARGRRRGRR
jgi:hypothetical protein